jgi:hypothetical protein
VDALRGFCAGDFVLRFFLEVLDLNDAFFDLGLAEDHRNARVDLVGATKLALEGAAPKIALYPKPCVAELPTE